MKNITQKTHLLLLLMMLNSFYSFSQIKKFGKVSVKEFNTDLDEIFTDADAVVLFKYRETKLAYYKYQGWKIETTIHERIRINNNKGLNNATKKINYYIKGVRENVSIKANTYNLENGEIIKTKLEKSNIFSQNLNEKWAEKVFTMPNVSKGSIVEWEYTTYSNYILDVEDGILQYNIPIKYLKIELKMPYELEFKYLINPKHKDKIKNTNGFSIILKNIQPLKEEPYSRNIELFRDKIIFEISSTKHDEGKKYTETWDNVSNTVNKHQKIGKQLKSNNYYKADLDDLLKNITDKDSIISEVYNFVKRKIVWNKKYGKLVNVGLKKAYLNGSGNVAEVNLLLISMLRSKGINANPILVSTRNFKTPYYPTFKNYNYIIVGVEFNNQITILDATEKNAPINILPLRAISERGRYINEDNSSFFVNLTPTNIALDKKTVNVKIDLLGKISGTMRSVYTNNYALNERNKLGYLSTESVIKSLENKYNNIEIEKVRLNNTKKIDKPFIVSSKFTLINGVELINDKVYFSPLFFLQKLENEFKSEKRNLPIDFGFPWGIAYEINIDIPKEYKTENIPENIIIKLENTKGFFSYKTLVHDDKLVVYVKYQINTNKINPEFYADLKDFYSKIVLKQSEKVVLIKR